jgi:hypothetical protein
VVGQAVIGQCIIYQLQWELLWYKLALGDKLINQKKFKDF